jgi:hypothetical protein
MKEPEGIPNIALTGRISSNQRSKAAEIERRVCEVLEVCEPQDA